MTDHGDEHAEPNLGELGTGPANPRATFVEMAVSAAGVGTFDWDLLTGTLVWDERLIDLFGYEPSAFDGTVEAFRSRVHPDDVPRVSAGLQQAIAAGGSYVDEFRSMLPAGGHRWLAARGQVLSDEHGSPVRMIGAAWDITASHGVQLRSELAGRRERLLSRISEQLGGTLRAGEAVHRLSRLLVPAVADWCVVTLLDDEEAAGSRRGVRTTASWHTDLDQRSATAGYAQSRLQARNDDALTIRALRSGQPQVLPVDATAELLALLNPGPMRELVAQLAPESVAVLPLPGRAGTIGTLTLANGAARGSITAEELATAEHAAARAGLVLATARSYRQQRSVAEGLQRSLLTAPPQYDGVQIAARYVPAAQAAEVGGDWYDAFCTPDGALALVIGDVVGHDTEAAAAMGQMRSSVRTLGAESNDGPADVLQRADRVLATLRAGILATTIIARLEQTGGQQTPTATRLRWSNAGHPAPAMVTAEGEVQLLVAEHTDLLLGVHGDAIRRESAVTLDRGAVLLLYTDGLVERRDQDLDHGLDRLSRTLADLAGRDLEEVCDELLTRMVPADPDDDVALIAVRLIPTSDTTKRSG